MAEAFSGLHPVDPSHLSIQGELRFRMERNFDRLEQPADYGLDVLFVRATDWPGDYCGRVLLTLVHLQRATGRKAKDAQQIVARLARELNPKGYLGHVSEAIDEQQWSGHGWLVSGLAEYYRETGDQTALKMAVGIVEGLFFQMRGKMHTYPRLPEQRVFEGGQGGTTEKTLNGWVLSTDIGCAFIALEGMVKVAELVDRPDMDALIEEMFEVFRAIDLVAVSAQLHSSLTASRMFLRYAERKGRPAMVETATRVYGLFRRTAITENYANYNWFRRPTWNEPCAVVDALALAFALWQQTGEAGYLDDVHHIYFNALGYAQKPHGGFGCDTCVGADATFLESKFYDVVGCCNMRGGVGLAHMAEFSWLSSGDEVVVPFYTDSTSQVTFADGVLEIAESTAYPLEGSATFVVTQATAAGEKTLRFCVPGWADSAMAKLTLNGSLADAAVSCGMLSIRRVWKQGDRVEVGFPVGLQIVGVMNPNNLPGLVSYRHGPLILGVWEGSGSRDREGLTMEKPGVYRAAGRNGIVLSPINDVVRSSDENARRDRKKILFRQA